MSERVTCRTVGGHQVEATNGTSRIVLDLSKADGGAGDGLSPHETLLAALGGCTAMTVSLYAARKTWPLQGVEVSIVREKAAVGVPDARERLDVELRFLGPLDDEQRARLAEIAKKCPVYKTLTGNVEVLERLA